MKIIARGIGILTFIIVVGLSIALILGYIYIGVKKPADTTPNHVAVCDDKDIQAYNAFVTQFSSTDEQQKAKATQMQAQVDTLKKKSGFENDPTCRFIAYSAAVANGDAKAAQTEQSAIKTFADQGIFPSNKLLDIASVNSMQDRINALTTTGDSHSNPLGSG